MIETSHHLFGLFTSLTSRLEPDTSRSRFELADALPIGCWLALADFSLASCSTVMTSMSGPASGQLAEQAADPLSSLSNRRAQACAFWCAMQPARPATAKRPTAVKSPPLTASLLANAGSPSHVPKITSTAVT